MHRQEQTWQALIYKIQKIIDPIKSKKIEYSSIEVFKQGPGAERGTILVLSTDLISPPPPGTARRVIATLNFSLQIPVNIVAFSQMFVHF